VTVLLLLWLPETPSSLLQRGKLTEARIALQRLRGTLQSTEQEFQEILQASKLFTSVRGFKSLVLGFRHPTVSKGTLQSTEQEFQEILQASTCSHR
jgi:hypothetical protein